jgi:hypothetical protein
MTDDKGVEYQPPGTGFGIVILIAIGLIIIPPWKLVSGQAETPREYAIGAAMIVVALGGWAVIGYVVATAI